MNTDEFSAAPGVPPDTAPQRASRTVQLLGLSLGHALNDAYVNFIVPLGPQIEARFALSHSGFGLITFLWGLSTNFGQPVFGYLTDRWRPKRLIVIATLISTFFFSYIGYAQSLPAFVAFLLLGGMGVALYHPRAGALTVHVSGSHRALGMGIFSAGGAVGYAAGFLCAPYLHGLTGDMRGLAYAAPAGVIGACLLLLVNVEGRAPRGDATFSFRRHILPRWREVTALFVVMVLRSAAVSGFSLFIPLMLSDQGRNLIQGGQAGFFFIAGGALGGMIGGHISDRIGRREITIVTLLLSPPILYYALHTANLPSLAPFFVLLFVAGLVMRAAEPVNITHTQEVLPQGASLAASLGMGGAWGVAGLIGPLVGAMADRHGVAYALGWVVWIPVAAAVAAWFIPKGDTHRN